MIDYQFTPGHGIPVKSRSFRVKRTPNLYRLLVRNLLIRPKSRQIITLAVLVGGIVVSVSPKATVVKAQVSQPVEINTPAPVMETQPLVLNSPVKEATLSQGYHLLHQAIDLAVPRGTKVYPIKSGMIANTSSSWWGLGKTVEINHGSGLVSKYAHLDQIHVRADEHVSEQTVIGTVGTTGLASGPHLHLEVKEKDNSVNPADYLNLP